MFVSTRRHRISCRCGGFSETPSRKRMLQPGRPSAVYFSENRPRASRTSKILPRKRYHNSTWTSRCIFLIGAADFRKIRHANASWFQRLIPQFAANPRRAGHRESRNRLKIAGGKDSQPRMKPRSSQGLQNDAPERQNDPAVLSHGPPELPKWPPELPK